MDNEIGDIYRKANSRLHVIHDFITERAQSAMQGTPWDQAPSPGIVVGSGQTVRIGAGSILHLQFLTIESDGILEILNGSSQFTCIKVAGELRVNGVIRARQHMAGLTSFQQPAPDGQILEAFIDERNPGGQGGDGARFDWPICRVDGGRGAPGSGLFGGGGGGAAGLQTSDSHTCTRGGDGSGIDGGQGGGAYKRGGSGGRGGRRNPVGHGGFLYLRVEGTVTSVAGVFDLRGESGENGRDGDETSRDDRRRGGGGGGGPGGQGGTLYLRAPSVPTPLTVMVDGGLGGEGGRSAFWGSSGSNGTQGLSGRAVYL